jgi:hypothetical protein
MRPASSSAQAERELLEFEVDLADSAQAHGRAREILRHAAAVRLISLTRRNAA